MGWGYGYTQKYQYNRAIWEERMARPTGLEPVASCSGGIQVIEVTCRQNASYTAKSTTYEKFNLPENATRSRLLTPNVIRNVIPLSRVEKYPLLYKNVLVLCVVYTESAWEKRFESNHYSPS